MKKIALLGSTGSIGVNALNIIRKYNNIFQIEILTAASNVEALAAQAIEFKPKYVGIKDESKFLQLKELLKNENIEIVSGLEETDSLASIKVDMSIIAIVGAAAIVPTINAIKAGNDIGLANKECLVCAGSLIMNLVKENNVKLIPIDSEHSGLFQIFPFDKRELLKNVVITASGGPFRNFTPSQLLEVTKAQALKHPNWAMGEKITIDSATMVNKCLEVIEAMHLFSLKKEQVEIIIHHESIVHAFVNMIDGASIAHFGTPNMQIPISYALFHPSRAELKEFNNFSLSDIGTLNFAKPNTDIFRILEILPFVQENIDNNIPIAFNVANELAVKAFLNEKIKFCQITEIISTILAKTTKRNISCYTDIMQEMLFINNEIVHF